MLQQASCRRCHPPLGWLWPSSPTIHMAANLVEDRGRIVLLLLSGKSRPFVEDNFFRFALALPLLGFRDRCDEFCPTARVEQLVDSTSFSRVHSLPGQVASIPSPRSNATIFNSASMESTRFNSIKIASVFLSNVEAPLLCRSRTITPIRTNNNSLKTFLRFSYRNGRFGRIVDGDVR